MLLLIVGCVSLPEHEARPNDAQTTEVPSSSVRCDNPVSGETRLSEVGDARGLQEPNGDAAAHIPGQGALLAEDVDADGDVDLAATGVEGVYLWLNDGAGQLEGGLVEGMPTPGGMALVEADGDLLPELWFWGEGQIAYAPNLGGGQFGDPVNVWTDPPEDVRSYLALAWGDLDGDQDLDVIAPAMGPTHGPGSPMRVLGNSDGVYEEIASLSERTGVIRSQAPMVTDIDHDGALDLFVSPDLVGAISVWHNDGILDGAPHFTDIAAMLGVAVGMAGMGMDNVDLNGDEVLDYCFSDIGPVRCFVSMQGSYFESGQALGLWPSSWVEAVGTVGWSIELVDLDNDGAVELVQASGEATVEEGETPPGQVFPDLLFWGRDGAFEDVTMEAGFGDLENHVGMAAADLTGDGYWDLVLSNPLTPPLLWDNPCGAGAWLDVDLVGPPGNRQGLGARVELVVAGVTLAREVHGLRSHGQGPSMAHFGLGDAERVDALRVRWPDGTLTELDDPIRIGLRQRLVVTHPGGAITAPKAGASPTSERAAVRR